MNEELDKDKLGKIVALAKGGIGGEKQNAIRIVKALCKKHNLDFDDVMENISIKEFSIVYRTKEELDLITFCFYRYGMLKYEDSIKYNQYSKKAIFNTTLDKYIEVLNAFVVLRVLYKKEKKKAEMAVMEAFRIKHYLYYEPTDKEKKKLDKERENQKIDEEALAINEMARGMSRGMQDAEIHKQLK